jgi:phytoene dehydrogenase-like protein
MDCEVAVVGGGIGGLTVAALLAQRGMNVCLFERESRVGGCAASYEKFGYRFEPLHGLYTGWQSGEIHEQVFSELPVAPPEVRRCDPGYAVRLPDGSEIKLASQTAEFETSLRAVFPECADAAVEFYRQLTNLSGALRRALQHEPNPAATSKARRAYLFLREGKLAAELLRSGANPASNHLANTSERFQRFIDLQLQTLRNGDTSEINWLHAALALTAPRERMFAIRGGAHALAETLAQSIRKSGGKVRLDTPVLRLAYDSSGAAQGVDLLNGETVTASKAIVSNLTLWDTYGKLVGLNRTPAEIRKQLSRLRSWGAYLLYLGMDEATADSLSNDHVLALTDWQAGGAYDPQAQFVFAAAPSWDVRGPARKRAVTVHFLTDVDEWFTYHRDETELEERDEKMLSQSWARLHSAMPELGSSVEVIETATPRTFYDSVRRKLGMVGGLPASDFWMAGADFATSLPNVFIVSDTASNLAGGIEGLTLSALMLANKLTAR